MATFVTAADIHSPNVEALVAAQAICKMKDVTYGTAVDVRNTNYRTGNNETIKVAPVLN